ncbi:ion channel [Sutcliffiella horikoshii]|uniref:ion channel n=1 Tax=Sutcliffiella horikoshii TaxID=79883 RepID=UPI00204192A7|nr:ion channel [Sutcliffiella horikoshii]MCM3616532.1 ion channel [Sutcliffiella horikoshii]
MFPSILIGLTIVFIVMNLFYFFTNKTYKKSYVNSALFLKLFFVMVGLTFGFAVLYYLLASNEVILKISDGTGDQAPEDFMTFLYFSGVTILSVGYGDLIPVGSARFFALIQASLGLLLPTAYFMKAMGSSSEDQ